MTIVTQTVRTISTVAAKLFSTASISAKQHFKLVIVGGGSAGAALSNKFGPKLGRTKLAVIEPDRYHWYQPGWSLVGGGLKSFEATRAPMDKILSKDATWLQDKIVSFQPSKNIVVTSQRNEIEYDFLVVALGVVPRFDLIKGLPEAFKTPGVCSNYDPNYVLCTLKAMKSLQSGHAVFTFPSGIIKCAGAPQKVMYLTDSYLRMFQRVLPVDMLDYYNGPFQVGRRDKVEITYNTSLDYICNVPKYNESMEKVAASRNIHVNVRTVLTEVKPDSREAIFHVFSPERKLIGQKVFNYDMLHVGPECSTVTELSSCEELVDSAGFVDVDKETLQHRRFPNVFAVGDCSNLPTTKTMAAAACQVGVLRKNLNAAFNGRELSAKYDGYTSCPVTTSRHKVILAEFSGYTGEPMETFPINQAKESRLMFLLKRYAMPFIYWNFFTKGWYEGPAFIRKAIRFGFSK